MPAPDKDPYDLYLSAASNILSDTIAIDDARVLASYIEAARRYNVYMLVAGVICFDLFGHSRPDTLSGQDALTWIDAASPVILLAAAKAGNQP
ncbi:hypothetical protein [Pannonibacter sp. SL95]|jgi:hypothetical protein|uniref:hypothetical protein n=1 Tax=Pannonibacter sp. SL95 TaxID=2995153 RepID=UPI002273C80E|nr:hypothetical protein [Pannonibacter sp. SL95]MCY1704509.1 hypothetical protein [Pannonibacter sp. SL95]MCY1707304.1 hypothetical protein [Pannonibacter sp. SL95]MCY1709029.1 hypothetical protein [Pannonibacter sp. SL95]